MQVLFCKSDLGALVNGTSVLVDGQIVTQTQMVDVTQFGPGYAVSADDVMIDHSSQDHVTFAPDGTQVAYQPNQTKATTLTLALSNADTSYQFQIQGADISAGQVVTETAELAQGKLAFSNANAGGGTYDLSIKRINATGEHKFTTELTILAGDTHYMDYGNWNGTGTMTLEIDHGSDGTIDQMVVLENQALRVYLPVVLN